MTPDYRLVVVGAGLIGAAAARHAARSTGTVSGRPKGRVAVIGPGEPDDRVGHVGPFASHYDSGRITRQLDGSAVWSELAARSIAEYEIIEATSGVSFHHDVGVLWADASERGLADLEASGARYDAPLERLSSLEAAARFRWSLPGRDLGFEPPPAGFIDPRRMVDAQLSAARKAGADHVDDIVVDIDVVRDGVRLGLRSGRTIFAARAVVAAGVYTGSLVRRIGVVPIAPIAVAVIKAELSAAEATSLAGMPAMIYRVGGVGAVDVYGVPPVRYPDGRWYLKLGAELLPEEQLSDTAAIAAWMSGGAPSWRAQLEARLNDLAPRLRIVRTVVEPCVYSRTPHRLPFVDHVSERLVVAAGGNGRAAKSADAIGAMAIRLVEEGVWSDTLHQADFALPPGRRST